MAQVVNLTVRVEPIDYEYGLWCRKCLLPSGVEITAMVTLGPSATIRVFNVCGDCHGFNVEPRK